MARPKPKATADEICIQRQLRFHIYATQAAIEGMKLAERGRRREALKAQAEFKRWELLYRKAGGKGPITYLMQQTH